MCRSKWTSLASNWQSQNSPICCIVAVISLDFVNWKQVWTRIVVQRVSITHRYIYIYVRIHASLIESCDFYN